VPIFLADGAVAGTWRHRGGAIKRRRLRDGAQPGFLVTPADRMVICVALTGRSIFVDLYVAREIMGARVDILGVASRVIRLRES
jgi:hypothetical protein